VQEKKVPDRCPEPGVDLLLAKGVRKLLEEGSGALELEGIGQFLRDAEGDVVFQPASAPRVFISYVLEDRPSAERLYTDLTDAGFHPWMDTHNLFPGQDWHQAIARAIRLADFFVPCFSAVSVRKRGTFQRELRYALGCNLDFPLEDSLLMPVRLDACDVPRRVASQFQYVDLFPNWGTGCSRLVESIRDTYEHRSLVS
jgi:hypothetical protein